MKHFGPVNSCFPGNVYDNDFGFSPVNFIDDNKRRWAYAAVFALISYKILLLFNGQYYLMPDEYNDPEWSEKWGWTKGNSTLYSNPTISHTI